MSDTEDPTSTMKLVAVTCGALVGSLHMDRFICPGIHRDCIEVNGKLVTPKAFMVMGDKEKLKDWKSAIRLGGQPIRKLMDCGQLDFYMHNDNCTGRCAAKTPKSGTDIGSDSAISSMGLPTMVPLSLSYDQGSDDHDSLDSSGKLATMKPNGAVGLSPFLPIIAYPHDVEEDNDYDVEDPLAFWQGIQRVGLFEDFVVEMKLALDKLQTSVLTNGLQDEDAQRLTAIAKELRQMNKFYWLLSMQKGAVERYQENLQKEIAELERQKQHKENRQEEMKRKRDRFNQLIDMGKQTKAMRSLSSSPGSSSVDEKR
ncbi:PREDICTED: glucocorticoid modulatory element-binding protein 1-like isoform X2 [Priapulus caudatus]|uniref:Glucocorticoid modulatory element-binding protein 1-like isoform X2 n=1 Tax=Priapulus caudatus TaxID=37621 RepID=A0ABM1E810_PRICU|nr:PREDICTED: glucocorticoid modulatory element-binding protein 1-like isoform X2 [Priapulus caudatus]